jgi:hypothetical protein
VFISLDMLVMMGIAAVAAGVTVLIALMPRIGIPVAVGVAVATLLFTMWAHFAGRNGGSR